MRVRSFIVLGIISSASIGSYGIAQPLPAPPVQSDSGLDAHNPHDPDGRPYRDHHIALQAGVRYDIAVSSDQFDTMLQVFRAGEDRALLTVDDSATDTNARTVFVPDRSGDYVVRALAFSPESLGTYHLLINAVPPLPAPLPTAAPAGTSAGRMSWRAYRGALAETDANSDGIPFDDYLVTLAAGEEIIVRLDSTQIDPLLRIYRADRRDSGTLTSDDDGGIGRNSMLAFAAPRAGNYVIRATAFWPTQTRARFGSYLLRIGR